MSKGGRYGSPSYLMSFICSLLVSKAVTVFYLFRDIGCSYLFAYIQSTVMQNKCISCIYSLRTLLILTTYRGPNNYLKFVAFEVT